MPFPGRKRGFAAIPEVFRAAELSVWDWKGLFEQSAACVPPESSRTAKKQKQRQNLDIPSRLIEAVS
jgi:hypothetical protein